MHFFDHLNFTSASFLVLRVLFCQQRRVGSCFNFLLFTLWSSLTTLSLSWSVYFTCKGLLIWSGVGLHFLLVVFYFLFFGFFFFFFGLFPSVSLFLILTFLLRSQNIFQCSVSPSSIDILVFVSVLSGHFRYYYTNSEFIMAHPELTLHHFT